MELMRIRRALMSQHVRTIGGLPVLYDNAAYDNQNGRIDAFIHDTRFFITGVFDTGSTASKSYTYTRYSATLDPADTSRVSTCFRVFNDLTASSYDYWSISPNTTARTLSFAGQYILFTVYKPEAANMYMYNNTAGVYLFKGKNV